MNIYVSNLGYGFQDQELNKLFADYGTVASAKIITDKFTGKSRGFGFVEMPDEQAAEKAVKELDGKVIDGRPVKVTEARPREENRNGKSSSFSKRW
ncbi:MAG: RNA recognition motif domain-containing protein [Agriterribacter sp.]